MLLSILDHNLERVGFLDNEENTQGLEFYDDMWSRYLETGSATFDFSVDKKNLDLDTHNRRVYQALNERSFVSFHHNGRAYLFNIMKTVEDEDAITCYCENLNLELLNEYANAYKADQAYTFEEYCKKLDLLDFAALKLGINEVSDQKRTIEWTGQDTKLKRLISLANNFDAEIAFETYLNDDSSLKVFRLNVFKEHDDTHQGVGARRDDIILDYDDNIESITRTIDKTTIFNMIHPTGSDKTVTHKVTKTRTVNKTVTVSGGGATNTENALQNIESRKGQRVGTGQCYALSALYSSLLGGPGLGGGVTGFSGLIGAGIAASNIGTDYRWGAFGWGVEAGSVSKAKAGAIVNIKANYGSPFWTGIYGHTAIIKSISGSSITVLEQNYAGRMYIVENTYNLNAYMAGVQTLCYPPELVAGKTVGGQAVTKTVPVQETYIEDVQETVKTVIDSSRTKEWKNSDGEVEFYVKNGNIYAPLSQKLYPAVLNGKVIGDNWIRKDISVETTDEAVLEATALKTLKAGCYPAVTYEVKGDADLEPGDTVKVRDGQFFPVLLLEMRASEVHRSFSNPDEDRTVFNNFKELENKVDASLLARMEEMAEAAVPYTIKISSDNGTTFKNSEGESLFKANLYKGEKLLASDVTWRWALDGNVTVGMQYLARASTINDTAVLTVSAYIGNNEVATTEITLTNVDDGKNGAKGDDGVGIDYVSNYYLATAQLNSVEALGDNLLVNADTFNDWVSVSGGDGTATVVDIDDAPLDDVSKAIRVVDNTTGNKDLRYKNALALSVGETYTISCFARKASDSPTSSVTLLMRSWTTNDTNRKLSTAISHTDWQFYSFTFTADVESNSIQFGQTGTGIIEICAPRLVKNQQSYGWTSATQVITESKRYLWHYRVEYYTNNTSKATAPAIIGVYGNKGDSGKDGVAGKDGVGLKATAITYAIASSGTTAPTSGWSDQVPTLTKGKYLWTKTVWTYTDNTSETGYQATYIAKDGNDGSDGIAGKDGVGIKSTTITYASSISGTTKPTSGWSSTIPSVSAGNYLWTRTIWTYTDNTSETGYSVAKMGETGAKGDKGETGERGPQGIQGLQGPKGDQGIQGEKGADGKTQYTHIAYADSATGGGFSQTDQTKAYIGMYQDFNATDSADPTKYRWTKWKGSDGAQGIPGKAGADGKTPYIHFAYASSADGKTDFSLTDGNQQYMGYYSDYTEADSTDYKKYKWVDRLANVQVGGRNLFLNSLFKRDLHASYSTYSLVDNTASTQGQLELSIDTSNTYLNSNSLKIVSTYDGTFNNQKVTFRTGGDSRTGAVDEMSNTSVMMSFYAKSTVENTVMALRAGYRSETEALSIGTDWKYYSFQLTAPLAGNATNEVIIHVKTAATVWIVRPKVEVGTVSTDFTEAPEDIQADIDSKADDALTQEQLNALAEKNRTLEAELEAKAALATVEAWKEAYDNYVAQNNQDKTEAEQKLITLTNRVAEWVKDWEDKKVQWSFLDTNMDFGAEGLRLGKKGSPTSILISNDRIGFYSGGSEVASMSNGTLTIDNGIFAKSLQIGHFREEVYESDSSINVIRWVD